MDEVEDVLFVTELITTSDIGFGYGVTQQVRDGELVDITLINAHNIPYTTPTGVLTTIGDVLDNPEVYYA